MNPGRLNRYQAAVMLAQEILQGNPRHDELRIHQALDDILGEVRAGRRNQQDMAEVNRVTASLLRAQGYSVRVDEPHLTLVKGDDA